MSVVLVLHKSGRSYALSIEDFCEETADVGLCEEVRSLAPDESLFVGGVTVCRLS